MKKIFPILALLLFSDYAAARSEDWVILEPAGFSPAYHHAATEFLFMLISYYWGMKIG